MANENMLSVDTLIKKRDRQSDVISSLVGDVNNLQTALEQRQQQLQLNQGALLQLNILLEELGVDVGNQDIGGEPIGDIPFADVDTLNEVEDEEEIIRAEDVEVIVSQ